MNNRYPKTNTEAKNFLQSLDRAWQIMLNVSNKRRRIREWSVLVRVASGMYREAVEKVVVLGKDIDIAKENFNVIGIVKLKVEFNFHLNFSKKLERWMKIKKIPF